MVRKVTSISTIPGYKEAKEFANKWNEPLIKYREETGLPINTLLAMSPGNDPFWMTAGKVLKAKWAEYIMETIILPHLKNIGVKSIHLRDIHYILTGQDVLTWDNTEKYQNTTQHWSLLIEAFANARYLRLVEPAYIRDNKNKYEKRTDYRDDYLFTERVAYGREELTEENVIKLFTDWFNNAKNWQNYMPVHIELWAEKDLSLLEQVARKYDINTVVGEGETSITQVYEIINRIQRAKKPVRIGYIADCDVVGSNMSKAMSRKMEFIISRLREGVVDVKLTHLMLTPTQVKQYGLPTIPMKQSKSDAYETRKDDWMEARGLEGSVEINSFHSLYPDAFRGILENFITSYFDSKVKDAIKSFNLEQVNRITDLVTEAVDIQALIDTIDDIDWDYESGVYRTSFRETIDDISYLDYEEWDSYYQWLLDSNRLYVEQLHAYRLYELGNLDNPEE